MAVNRTTHVTIHSDMSIDSVTQLPQLAEAELLRGFGEPHAEEHQLLWRASVFQCGWVLLVFHHSIADGRSRTTLMEAIVQVASKSGRRTNSSPSNTACNAAKRLWTTRMAAAKAAGVTETPVGE